MNFVNLIYTKFYHTDSSTDVGTMYHLRNKLDRRDVSSDTKNYRACNSFLQDVLSGYIVACTMQHFGMSSPDETDVIPPGLPSDQKQAWFSDEMLKIVDKFVLQWKELEHTAGVFVGAIGSGRPSVSQPSVQSITQHHQQEHMLQQHFADEVQVQAMKQGQLQQPAGETEGRTSSQLQTYRSSLTALLRQAHALYHQTSPAGIRAQGGQLPSGTQLISPLQPQTSIVCHVTSCGEVFASDADRRHHERLLHNLTRVPLQHQSSANICHSQSTDDHTFNYSCNLMKMALLERNFQDAVHEMDGPRLLRLWKFKMLHFKAAGRTKYALEALLFQADQLALLSPWDAYRQLWNRSFNLRGGIGKNIPLDLMVEHNNNFIKEMVRNQGANVTFHSAQQISRASKGLDAVLTNLDNVLAIQTETGRHAVVDKRKDVLMIAHEVKGNVIQQKEPRAHRAFPKMSPDVLHEVDPSKLVKWVQGHKRALARLQELNEDLGL